jgi:hypothetical protein
LQAWGGWAIGLDSELSEKVISADVAGVVLQGGAISQAGKEVTNGAADSLFFNSEDGAFGDEVRVGVIKFEEALQDLAGSLIDLANTWMVVKIFGKEGAKVLDFNPHGESEGQETMASGLGIGGARGGKFGKVGSGGAGGVLH